MNPIEEWLTRITGGKSHRAIATEVNVQNSVLSRWVRLGTFPATNAVAVARHYGTDPVEALCATGVLTEEEYEAAGKVQTLRKATDRALTAEMYRRVILRDEFKNEPATGEHMTQGLGAEKDL